MHRCIKLLPDGYRIILGLYLLEGYDHEEIGEILGYFGINFPFTVYQGKVQAGWLIRETGGRYELNRDGIVI
jgi:hypothetical protein